MRHMLKKMNNLIGFLSLYLLIFPGIAFADISTGLVAHFKFEKNIADSSPSSFAGVINGNLSFVPGIVGNYAAKFDGNTYIAFPTKYLYPLFNGTINLFVNVSPDFNVDAHIMGCKTNYKTEIGFDSISPLTYAGTTLKPDNWYMITHVYSNGGSQYGSEKIYVNGKFIHEQINYRNNGYIGGSYTAFPYYSAIGRDIVRPLDGPKFKGLIDDVRIYNRALSATEIQELNQLRQWTTVKKWIVPYGWYNKCVDSSGFFSSTVCANDFNVSSTITVLQKDQISRINIRFYPKSTDLTDGFYYKLVVPADTRVTSIGIANGDTINSDISKVAPLFNTVKDNVREEAIDRMLGNFSFPVNLFWDLFVNNAPSAGEDIITTFFNSTRLINKKYYPYSAYDGHFKRNNDGSVTVSINFGVPTATLLKLLQKNKMSFFVGGRSGDEFFIDKLSIN
ncbi:Concanavalin A-like lectin/glucanases superfamily protein [Syntrophus gentianae]|uniref:Concanavalin A-like lectin/glucanases superfamily protein n=1 Tax=Syntrophus gentianae TaxID=43775 RepID=A0A1H7UI75_9BACT|nr:LamG-like jellyroll fold domain-containing protein [Syntrophus gentianae]SEL96732.1 Concanavalin A-like lectin/glucanases superfamily protein [Syntrophus gentianae]